MTCKKTCVNLSKFTKEITYVFFNMWVMNVVVLFKSWGMDNIIFLKGGSNLSFSPSQPQLLGNRTLQSVVKDYVDGYLGGCAVAWDDHKTVWLSVMNLLNFFTAQWKHYLILTSLSFFGHFSWTQYFFCSTTSTTTISKYHNPKASGRLCRRVCRLVLGSMQFTVLCSFLFGYASSSVFYFRRSWSFFAPFAIAAAWSPFD